MVGMLPRQLTGDADWISENGQFRVPGRKEEYKSPLINPPSTQQLTTNAPKYQCTECRKDNFRDLSHYRSHLIVHTIERPYACDRCPHRYKQRKDLIVHKNKRCANTRSEGRCRPPLRRQRSVKTQQSVISETNFVQWTPSHRLTRRDVPADTPLRSQNWTSQELEVSQIIGNATGPIPRISLGLPDDLGGGIGGIARSEVTTVISAFDKAFQCPVNHEANLGSGSYNPQIDIMPPQLDTPHYGQLTGSKVYYSGYHYQVWKEEIASTEYMEWDGSETIKSHESGMDRSDQMSELADKVDQIHIHDGLIQRPEVVDHEAEWLLTFQFVHMEDYYF